MSATVSLNSSPERSPASALRPWTLADLTRECAGRWPDSAAVVDGDLQLTFKQLQHAAHAIAHRLKQCGVGHGDRVVLLGAHSAAQVAAILGTSLLGAAFVPLDPALPRARLLRLLADAQPRAVLALAALHPSLELPKTAVLVDFGMAERCVRAASTGLVYSLPVQPTRPLRPEDAAYIIYTSGSTGEPKGVVVEHRALRAFFEAHNEGLNIAPGDRCLNTGPFHFDVSIMDVFLPLYFGATVHLGPTLPVGSLIVHELAQRRITHFYAVGTVLAQITGDGSALDRHDLRSLKVLQTGAEVCKPAVVDEWLRRLPQLRFLNSYGPTEVTVGCIRYLKPELGPLAAERCPIGMPHRGTSVLLLDETGSVIRTPDTVGELLLGGDQLMRGYWNKPEASERAFVSVRGARYYRSGDYAYRDSSGLYWFVGRKDDQIKFHGHRFHLGELRAACARHPQVQSAAAAVICDLRGREQLAAIAQVGCEPGVALARELREQLRAQLPSWMVPGVLALTASWPRLPSGKADTKRCLRDLQRAVRRHGAGIYAWTGRGCEPLIAQPRAARTAAYREGARP
jgi:amino acid adenylation domain-containing protein